MSLRFEGPSNSQIQRAILSLKRDGQASAQQVIANVAPGVASIIKRVYQKKVYQGPLGVFGYPKDQSQRLAQAVNFEVGDLSATVFTNSPHAGYVEFGTGIYNTLRAGSPILPRGGRRFLAFPAYTLPSDFKGFFIPREKAKNVPYGAIGLVLSRKVRGMKPTPVWFAPETLAAINSLVDLEIRQSGIFKNV